MSDVLFKCWQCAKNLSIADTAVGKSVHCPQCDKELIVPKAEVNYSCPKCSFALSSPVKHATGTLTCPSCDTDLIVPQESTRPLLLKEQGHIVRRIIHLSSGIIGTNKLACDYWKQQSRRKKLMIFAGLLCALVMVILAGIQPIPNVPVVVEATNPPSLFQQSDSITNQQANDFAQRQ